LKETDVTAKPSSRRRSIPAAERLKVWVRSGGRCAICGRYLLEGQLTHREFSLGELAHIVGQQGTAASPRGQAALSAADRDKADNLMLTCAGEHDEIDRGGALDVLTAERLHKIKRDHEDWVRRMTGLDRNRGTAVLRMIGQVQGNSVELTRPSASAAILRSDERFPDFPLSLEQYGVEIDLRHLPGEHPGDDAYWASGKARIDEVIDHKLSEAVRGERVQHLSVFAFARLPLLVYLGSKLDDTFDVAIYQRHRSTQDWAWPDGGTDVTFQTSRPGQPTTEATEAVLVINVSGTIQAVELPEGLANLPQYCIAPSGLTPSVDTMNSRASLAAFDRHLRALFSELEASSKGVRRLHVLAAAPVAAAVAIGRAHHPTVHPDLVIYDRAPDGQYRTALEIS
jgi:hypothetical protein